MSSSATRPPGEVEVFPLPEGILAERDVRIAMRDGTKLSVNLYRPKQAGRFPVVMAFTVYGKDANAADYAPEQASLRESIGLALGSFRISECTPWEAPDPAYWVPRGYAVVHADEPRRIVGARNGSPLIVGVGSGEYLIASDVSAMLRHTRQVIYLEDLEMVVLGDDGPVFTKIEDGDSELAKETTEIPSMLPWHSVM